MISSTINKWWISFHSIFTVKCLNYIILSVLSILTAIHWNTRTDHVSSTPANRSCTPWVGCLAIACPRRTFEPVPVRQTRNRILQPHRRMPSLCVPLAIGGPRSWCAFVFCTAPYAAKIMHKFYMPAWQRWFDCSWLTGITSPTIISELCYNR